MLCFGWLCGLGGRTAIPVEMGLCGMEAGAEPTQEEEEEEEEEQFVGRCMDTCVYVYVCIYIYIYY